MLLLRLLRLLMLLLLLHFWREVNVHNQRAGSLVADGGLARGESRRRV